MSPTEFDLRAALRDGEGDELDADQVMAGARAVRARRRSRMLSTAATVVVVAAVGGLVAGVASLAGNNNGQGAGSSGPVAGGANGPAVNAPHAAGRAGGAGSAATIVTLPNCPATMPRTSPPAGGSSAALLPQDVRSFVVCSYGEPARAASGGSPVRIVLTGKDAAALGDSLRNAPAHPLGIACPNISLTQKYSLAILGVTGSGQPLPPITTTLTLPACDVTITNGTAVRYGWRPPADLAQRLTALSSVPGTGPAQRPSSPPGANSGSPVR